ncbi:bifunctional methylenetetrahydrofolate dehydrogenase/methenyltetrahydrofolate cyclohydrolase [uncultured Clostridium sp.]|uniref:bifunctional methylenetetrahydrofolate dehydrogenase/methenyltetrahydrofolate cyclohydrolase n=1 Tax=uncultured Clostridium sp. TaxID=59620 RepID=UPI001A2B26A0|nr:bifunctional methylenetetrahydrofolate dehydrogenase/methenyltetrahydrofolate cyclohydrolase [uncultured Clostridium sp.]HAT4226577.1 bifunctional methylenetetrahydrofolate dehydrogenase/methenyltetrahydrofolate cyclohydrolase [Clostridium perfringens]HBI7032901.1 bifunctional methylenetetrahydrofolate dehydrogenase/methenyltetrahydrofolate cyclohydrolase [Clostridium perfringens]HBI7046897.1 bifunctional methylenetetrahydrofolate dehydrogenase/methenyltetrahydrofolate cyclohydrolase [Clostri
MDKILSGKTVAIDIKGQIKSYTEELKASGKSLKISSILVGDDGGSVYYQNFQEKLANSLGIDFEKIKLDESISEENLKLKIEELNKDDSVNGIMLLLPLPEHIDERVVTNLIDADKDLDCLSEVSVGRFYKGEKCFMPCTPNSVITLLKAYNIEIEGKEVVIIGRSNIVGKPLFQMFLNENATVTVCHSKTKNLKEVCKRADILVVAIGRANFIDSSYVREGAVVIDVGTSEVNGKITGDVNFGDVYEKASLITPVPGGVGSLTTTLLLKNVCKELD